MGSETHEPIHLKFCMFDYVHRQKTVAAAMGVGWGGHRADSRHLRPAANRELGVWL